MTGAAHGLRPTRDLIMRLPQLPMSDTLTIDFQSADRDLLLSIGADAEAVMSAIQAGTGAIGHLLAHSAVVIEDGTVGADSLESLGFLLAELGDLAVACMLLATSCRRAAAVTPPHSDPLNTSPGATAPPA